MFFLEYRYLLNRRKEREELREFSEFLSNVCYEYELSKSVTEAVYLSLERVEGGIRKSLEMINRILLEDAEEELSGVQFPGYLKQLKLFLIQCRNAILYGGGRNGKESVFVRNMTELRRDVQNECLKREQASFLFAGLGVISALPLLFMPLVKSWGSGNMPELIAFYEGTVGKLCVAAAILLTAICYVFLSLVRKVDGSLYQRPGAVGVLLENRAAEWLCRFFPKGKAEEWGKKQLEKAGIYRKGAEYFLACAGSGTVLAVLIFFLVYREGILWTIGAAALGFLLGIGGMMGFYCYLSYLKKLGVNGEVLGLQSIILMLFEAPNMTISCLLETMEEYAAVFRKELLACADRYAAEEEAALLRLIETTGFSEFRRLLYRLHISERLGLRHAFAELSADRQYFREQQRMDTEQELKKRAANAQVVAFLPMFFVLFAYLIIPFLAASLSQMTEIFSEMNQMKMF